MSHAIVLCLVLVAAAAAQIRDDGDDGSYNADKYEKPYEYNAIYEQETPARQYQGQPQAYQPQPQAYQPQPQVYQQAQPQPQVYQQAQPQVYQQQPQVYQPQPAPVQYNPAPQTYARPTVTDSRNAAILSEARYLQNDGKFGASYTQEDGVEFKEESDPDGTRRGSYSYVDPSGQRRTVSYTAGKQGFVASGDHLPVGPTPVPAAAAPAPQAYQPAPAGRAYQPQPQVYEPQPQAYQPQPRTGGPQIGLTVGEGGYSYNSRF